LAVNEYTHSGASAAKTNHGADTSRAAKPVLALFTQCYLIIKEKK
jgi:hypothetical protein